MLNMDFDDVSIKIGRDCVSDITGSGSNVFKKVKFLDFGDKTEYSFKIEKKRVYYDRYDLKHAYLFLDAKAIIALEYYKTVDFDVNKPVSVKLHRYIYSKELKNIIENKESIALDN